MKKKTIKIIVTVLMLLLIIIGALFYDQLIVRPELSVESVSHVATTINFAGASAPNPGDGKTVAIQFQCVLNNKSFTEGLKDVEFVYSNPEALPSFVIGRKLGKTMTKVDLPPRTLNKKITLVALVLSDGTDTEKIIKELEKVPVNIAVKKQGGFEKKSKSIFLEAK